MDCKSLLPHSFYLTKRYAIEANLKAKAMENMPTPNPLVTMSVIESLMLMLLVEKGLLMTLMEMVLLVR